MRMDKVQVSVLQKKLWTQNIEEFTNMILNFKRLAHRIPKVHPQILRRSRKVMGWASAGYDDNSGVKQNRFSLFPYHISFSELLQILFLLGLFSIQGIPIDWRSDRKGNLSKEMSFFLPPGIGISVETASCRQSF